MKPFKVGDQVRVVKLPHDGWTPKMPIGRNFSIARTEQSPVWGTVAYDDSNSTYIPLDCLEHVATTDYPWRVLDQNDRFKVWECVDQGEYYQGLSTASSMRCLAGLIKGWRCELGEKGYKVGNGGGCTGDYTPRVPYTPPSIDELAAHCVAEVKATALITPEPPKPKWPTRSDRVAVLRAEMSIPLTERALRVKR